MRIVGYIEHPHMKVTIFKMANRYSIKFEIGLLEQTYKFRTGDQLETIQDVRQLVDKSFQTGVLEQFQQLQALRRAAEERYRDQAQENEFDTII
ncbi:MAG: hypothetical protein AAF798_04195 [Bacteroidota bacterium]